MKRLANIWEKVCDLDNIYRAHLMASKDKHHRKEVEEVNADLGNKLRQIQAILQTMQWRPAPYQKFMRKERGKMREICKSPYFPDRIIHWAIMLQIEKRMMANLIDQTCASIPGRGIAKGIKYMKKYLEDIEGTKYCLKLDISKFYGNIDHSILMHKLRTLFKDADLIENIRRFVESDQKGLPIGSYMSQNFANLYLSDLDHYIKEVWGIKYYVRYMDDIVILAPNKDDLHRIKRVIDGFLAEHLNLRVKGNWQVFPVEARGVDFLGFRFFHGKMLLRRTLSMRMRRATGKIGRRIRKGLRIRMIDVSRYLSYMGWILASEARGFFARFFLPIRGVILEKKRCFAI